MPADLQTLFVHHFRDLAQLLQPGLNVVTWNSLSVHGYVAQIMEVIERLQDLLGKVKDLYDNRVLSNLRRISRTCLVRIPTDMVTTERFIAEQERIIRANAERINLRAIEIERAINDVIDLVSTSATQLAAPVAPEAFNVLGAEVVVKLWGRVHQAVLACIKCSIATLRARVRSSSLAGLLGALENPFFKVPPRFRFPRPHVPFPSFLQGVLVMG